MAKLYEAKLVELAVPRYTYAWWDYECLHILQKTKLNTDLELGEFVGSELLSWEDEPDYVLREESEASEVQHFIPVLVYKLQNLKKQPPITSINIFTSKSSTSLEFVFELDHFQLYGVSK